MDVIERELEHIPILGAVIGIVHTIEKDVNALIAHGLSADPIKHAETIIGHGLTSFGHVLGLTLPHTNDAPGWLGGEFVRALYIAMVGVDPESREADASGAVHTLGRIMAFLMTVPIASAGIQLALTAIGAKRVSESIGENIGKLGEEIGLNWALGMTMDRMMEAALGTEIEEAIAYHKRPTRLEWPVVRTLLKQHYLDDAQAEKYLRLMGYPDDLIRLIKQLDSAQLPVGDIQQMYLYGIIEKEEITPYLHHLGYTGKDADRIYALYIKHAQTQVSALLRTTMRGMVRNGHQTIDDYQRFLEHAEYPPIQIADDIEALKLETSAGRVDLSMSLLKRAYLSHRMHEPEVIRHLEHLGYNESAAHTIIAEWDVPTAFKTRDLSAAQILRYHAAGISLTPSAHDRLVSLGYSDTTATFMLDHPLAHAATGRHPLTVALVEQAYISGAIHEDEFTRLLGTLGVPATQIDMLLHQVRFRLSHRRHNQTDTLGLSRGDIINAVKFGIHDQHWAQTQLENLGYSSDDAWLLLEIENKGPITTPPPPLFASLQAALDWLAAHGYTVNNPPDPHIMAAEMLVEQYGYSVSPPPLPGPAPSGGGGGILPIGPPGS